MPSPDGYVTRIIERGWKAIIEGDEMDAILALGRIKLLE
jgi:hypothetical protein